MAIHVLPKAVAERIAAGEVVERPASVVKELIENALDAGATAIAVEVREGGTALIRLSDNGSGMSRADAPLAVERFATSKIETDRDLQNVRTLGFRGEALPSIGAVSQLELITRTRDEIEGTHIRMFEGGARSDVSGAPVGTQVIVRDLFYNAPARKKFLKSPFRESELIQKTITQYALAYPQVAFRLVVDGREQLNWAAATPLERVGAVWGREAAGEMIEVNHTSLDLSERGLISRPTLARGSREWQLFFVNGRPIRSGLLAVMLERPYAGRLPPNRHPLAIIQIEVNPQFIDVNVHPRKAEVRFYQERAIYGALTHAVEEALRDFPLTFQAGGTDWSFADTPLPGGSPMLYESRAEYYAGPWRALAQLNRTYILAQSSDGLLVVDQHSAQEQVFFERLTGGSPAASAERRASPVVMQLMPNEARLLNDHAEEYQSLGIVVEPFGPNAFRLSALPAFVRLDASELLTKLLAEHERHRTLSGEALVDKLASKLACLSAVKAGDALTAEQQQQLLDELLIAYSPATCPHGRPTFVAVSLAEIEQRFLRR
ncbi:MAG TPA: DNA mismatch repair endonuclease MutL [Chloroflexota bacterium]|nr:DNA mismatch repair endonuclease MutL [Chloroflexota bacterium]